MALVASFLHSLCKAKASFWVDSVAWRVEKLMWDAVLDWLGGLAGRPPGLAAAVEAPENAGAAGQGCRNDVHPWCSDHHRPEAGVTNIF